MAAKMDLEYAPQNTDPIRLHLNKTNISFGWGVC